MSLMGRNPMNSGSISLTTTQRLFQSKSTSLMTGAHLSPFSTRLGSAWGTWSYPKVSFRIFEAVSSLSVGQNPSDSHFSAVEVPDNILVQKLLDTKGVYILDCHTDVFVWYVDFSGIFRFDGEHTRVSQTHSHSQDWQEIHSAGESSRP